MLLSWQYSHLSSLIYSPSMMNETYSTLFDRVDIRFLHFFLDLWQQICNSTSSIFKLPPLYTSIILTFRILASILFRILSNIFNILEFKRGWFVKCKREAIFHRPMHHCFSASRTRRTKTTNINARVRKFWWKNIGQSQFYVHYFIISSNRQNKKSPDPLKTIEIRIFDFRIPRGFFDRIKLRLFFLLRCSRDKKRKKKKKERKNHG